ncbi:uncharacterized protein LOC132266319 [Cornus florida]|uniref:uncharacterized protein LOC132266319 n=1 Tax=Cornus florida TaxID=4283 RepID=UPI0028971501|nr:uncharacterized protein LOC132266319 [Cornus florida]
MAHELMRGIGAKKAKPRLAWKIDLRKAYDTVQWSFLFKLMQLFGFGKKWISWIHKCITSVWFSVVVNGSPNGYFQPERGMMQTEVQCGKVIPTEAAVQAGIPITHQFFADDLLIVFEYTSGLAVSKEKSEVFLTDSVRRRSTILRALGCKSGKLYFTYLGLPIYDKILRSRDCIKLVENVISLTTRWNGLYVSMAGRVELVRACILPLVLYWTSVYSLPDVVVNLIERRISNYIWGHVKDRKKLHGLRWNKITAPKEEGGLGLRRLVDIDMRDADSSIWKSIVAVRDVIKVNCRYKIGNGHNIKLFLDPWCEELLGEKINLIGFLTSVLRLLGRPAEVLIYLFTRQICVGMEADLDETLDHLFCNCPYAWAVWSTMSNIFSWNLQKAGDVQELATAFIQKFQGKKNKFGRILFTAGMYFILRERNERVHNDICKASLELAKTVIWEVLDVKGVILQDVL